MLTPNRKRSRKACQRTAKPGRQPDTLHRVTTPNTASPIDCPTRAHTPKPAKAIEIPMAPAPSCATKERAASWRNASRRWSSACCVLESPLMKRPSESHRMIGASVASPMAAAIGSAASASTAASAAPVTSPVQKAVSRCSRSTFARWITASEKPWSTNTRTYSIITAVRPTTPNASSSSLRASTVKIARPRSWLPQRSSADQATPRVASLRSPATRPATLR